MQEKEVRSIAWFGSLAIFFPLWVGAQAGFSKLTGMVEARMGLTLPPWLYGFFTFVIFGGILLLVAYGAAYLLNRNYPDSPARAADWNQQNGGFRRR